MPLLLAVVIGGLYATALYLILRRSIVKLLIGLALLTNAANLLIFTSAGLTRATAPIVPLGSDRPPAPFADPLAQAMILTAIVIGFGVLAFMVVLVHRAVQAVGTDDLDDLKATDT
ncbi:MAG: Na+/H+ antiporter subunit C [Armatimonadetes bacterium]|nr:Na+/H+ antiporter subunit C [Armatimonadota bacterium]